jgi:hypothetical protein
VLVMPERRRARRGALSAIAQLEGDRRVLPQQRGRRAVDRRRMSPAETSVQLGIEVGHRRPRVTVDRSTPPRPGCYGARAGSRCSRRRGRDQR